MAVHDTSPTRVHGTLLNTSVTFWSSSEAGGRASWSLHVTVSPSTAYVISQSPKHPVDHLKVTRAPSTSSYVPEHEPVLPLAVVHESVNAPSSRRMV